MTSVMTVGNDDTSVTPGEAPLPDLNAAKFLERAGMVVVDNFNQHRNSSKSKALTSDGIQLVSFSKVLLTFKAVFNSPLARGLLWEVTYNWRRNEIYLTVYSKLNQIKVPLGDAG